MKILSKFALIYKKNKLSEEDIKIFLSLFLNNGINDN